MQKRPQELIEALNDAPSTITIRDDKKALWELFVFQCNQDPVFGEGLLQFTIDWARLMEKRLANGEYIFDITEETFTLANYNNVSGSMFTNAMAVLYKTWIHGPMLKAWQERELAIKTVWIDKLIDCQCANTDIFFQLKSLSDKKTNDLFSQFQPYPKEKRPFWKDLIRLIFSTKR